MAEKIWNVGAYTRLSRDDGDKAESESIGSQKEIIRDFIQNKKDMVIIKEYIDDGYSGVSFERPGFKQMMEDVKTKKIDCIICIQWFAKLFQAEIKNIITMFVLPTKQNLVAVLTVSAKASLIGLCCCLYKTIFSRYADLMRYWIT